MNYAVRSDVGTRTVWLQRVGKKAGRWQYAMTERAEDACLFPLNVAEEKAWEWSDVPGVWRPVYRLPKHNPISAFQ